MSSAFTAGTVLETRNPSDLDEVVGTYAETDATGVNAAVQAARDAQPAWAAATPWQRSQVLDGAGTEVLQRADELGRLLAREEGKPLNEARGEVLRAGQILKYFAGEALRLHGEAGDSVRPGVRVQVDREALGVVGLITPWNFPIAIPAWKMAPALAFGNAVVIKPSEVAPGCAAALVEILHRAGLPKGALQILHGRGSVTGAALAEHPGLDGLSFTGSQIVGRRLAELASFRPLRLQLEMGGKNPLVVLDDADLDRAVEAALQGAFFSTGQRCTASSRLIVTEGIHDRFVAALAERTKALRVGPALDPATEIGPVVNEAQLDKDLRWIARGQADGGRLLCGGNLVKGPARGLFLAPALFSETTNAMAINQTEVFGPVACVIRVRDFDEALHAANDTPFGLSAGICTSNLKYAEAFRRGSRAGMVMVNLPTAGVDFHVPFGGTKASSQGPREQGPLARDFYTTVKTTYLAP